MNVRSADAWAPVETLVTVIPVCGSSPAGGHMETAVPTVVKRSDGRPEPLPGRHKSSASEEDAEEKEVVEIKTEMKIQFKDLFNRVKRMESIMIAATGSIIGLLVAVLMKMG